MPALAIWAAASRRRGPRPERTAPADHNRFIPPPENRPAAPAAVPLS